MTAKSYLEFYKAMKAAGPGQVVHATHDNAVLWSSLYKRGVIPGEDPDNLVNHPPHYTGHPSGVECIQITEYMNFCRGNAVKYIWRCGEKGDPVQDLKKARWYIDREIERLEKAVDNSS